MYPFMSYMELKVMHEERVGQMEDAYRQTLLAQPHRPIVRSLAHTLGQNFIALGNCLEHFGQ
jgi:hypothetical protein